MVEQPIQVEQALVDDVLVGVSLVLDDDRAAVLVQSERIDAAAMLVAGAVLAGQKALSERILVGLRDSIMMRGRASPEYPEHLQSLPQLVFKRLESRK